MEPGGKIGIVLAGGGARGAYEAGALSVLMPALTRRGERASIFVGASVGAVNAAALAGMAHLSADEAAEVALLRWRQIRKRAVMRPMIGRQLPVLALRSLEKLLSRRGARIGALLDPAPLGRSLRRWIDWPAVHANVGSGRVDAVAAVATEARAGRSVVFVESAENRQPRSSDAVGYVASALTPEHLMASSAVPMVFPPVWLGQPPAERGWYLDGAIRLHQPIKPCLDLGADRVIMVAMASAAGPRGDETADGGAPDLADGAVNVLRGLLGDSVIADLRTLGSVNRFYVAAEAPDRYRAARGKPPYRRVPFIFVAPERRGAIGDMARAVARSRYRGLRALRSPDFALINRMLCADSPLGGELLSYLLFDRDFIDELLAMGQRDARRLLAGTQTEGPWQTEALPPPDSYVSVAAQTPAKSATPATTNAT